jgi:hypothetical protein
VVAFQTLSLKCQQFLFDDIFISGPFSINPDSFMILLNPENTMAKVLDASDGFRARYGWRKLFDYGKMGITLEPVIGELYFLYIRILLL